MFDLEYWIITREFMAELHFMLPFEFWKYLYGHKLVETKKSDWKGLFGKFESPDALYDWYRKNL